MLKKFRFLLCFIILIGLFLPSLVFAIDINDPDQQNFINTVKSWLIPFDLSSYCDRYIVMPVYDYNDDDSKYVSQIYLFMFSDDLYLNIGMVGSQLRYGVNFADSGYYCRFSVSYSDFLNGKTTSWNNPYVSRRIDDFAVGDEISLWYLNCARMPNNKSNGIFGDLLVGDTYFHITKDDMLACNLTIYNSDGSIHYSPHDIDIYFPFNGLVYTWQDFLSMPLKFSANGLMGIFIDVNGQRTNFISLDDLDLTLEGYEIPSLFQFLSDKLDPWVNNSINTITIYGVSLSNGEICCHDTVSISIQSDPFSSYVEFLQPVDGFTYSLNNIPDLAFNVNMVDSWKLYCNGILALTGAGNPSSRIYNTYDINILPIVNNAVNNLRLEGFLNNELVCSQNISFTLSLDPGMITNPDDPYHPPVDDWNRPVKPGEDSGWLDWVKYYCQELIYILSFPIRLIGDVVHYLGLMFTQATNYVSQLVSIISSFFSFIPSEWIYLVSLSLTVGIVLKLIGR